MVQSVELLLSEPLEAAVQAQWSGLGDAGVPHAGLHTGPTNRPHVTLAVAPQIHAGRESVIAAASTGLPLAVRLGGLVLFGGSRGQFVLARLVVPSAGLLALHAAVSRAVADDRLGHVRPGEWTPHVTLARRLTPDQVAIALIVADLAADLSGDAVAVRRWDSDARRDWLIS